MDLEVTNWLRSTASTDKAPAELLETGMRLLQQQPTLPRVVAADCHCRLAALFALDGNFAMSARHATHAITMALDMTVEAQLHVLSRAASLARHAMTQLPDRTPGTEEALGRAFDVLAAAMEASVAAADINLTRLAALRSIDTFLTALTPAAAEASRPRIGQHAAALARDLEAAGELALSRTAAELARSPNVTS